MYVDSVKYVICDVIKEYAETPYRPESLSDIPKTDLQFVISDQLFLDVLLIKIRSNTISFATMKKRETEDKEKCLEDRIRKLDSLLYLSDEGKRQLELDKRELISIRERKLEGVLLRSRARWVADGEKVSNYFCNLESINYVSKQVRSIVRPNGEELKETEDIIKEVKLFYESLYSHKKVNGCNISDLVEDIPILTEQEQNSLEGEISLEEATIALKNMKKSWYRWFPC